MTRPRFAYIVQLDLPNAPVKIGQSSSIITRIESFNSGTPCSLRIVGATLGGKQRESELLEATKDRVLKGEWRMVNDALRAMVSEIYLRGEWYVPQPNVADVWKRHAVLETLGTQDARFFDGRKPSVTLMQSYAAKNAVAALAETHPALALHICGFDVANHAPSLTWPRTGKSANAA